MGSAWKIGTVFGIPIRIHYTWLIIFVLITGSLIRYVPGADEYPLYEKILFALATSLMFFISITIHELFHCVVAIRSGIPVKDITLFVFGGVSQISREASKPGTELFMAVMGPISSFALAGIFYGVAGGLAATNWYMANVFAQSLAVINLNLGIFNLIPGYPLDGGRVLRSIIWMVNKSYTRSTRIATTVGKVIAYLFILAGIITLFIQDWFAGLWMIFIGWFLADAAGSSQRQLDLKTALKA